MIYFLNFAMEFQSNDVKYSTTVTKVSDLIKLVLI